MEPTMLKMVFGIIAAIGCWGFLFWLFANID